MAALTIPERSDAKPRVDATDIQILNVIIDNARISNVDLAAAVGIAPSTCLLRLRALESRGVIKKYGTVVDLEAVGLTLMAIIAVRMHSTGRRDLKSFAQRLADLPIVQTVYFLSGDKDFLIHIACASTAEMRDFVTDELSGDPGVAHTQTSIVFETFESGPDASSFPARK